MLHENIRHDKPKINNLGFFLAAAARGSAGSHYRPGAVSAQETAPPAGTDGALMYFLRKEYYFLLRRRAQRPARAIRESVPVAGSGVSTSLENTGRPCSSMLMVWLP